MGDMANGSDTGGDGPHVLAIGSCRIYKPLGHALDRGLLRSFTNVFPHVHNPVEIVQAFGILQGDIVPPPELRDWMGLKGFKYGGPEAFAALIAKADLFVIELSSVRIVNFQGWEFQFNHFRQKLEAEGIAAPLIQKLHGTPTQSDEVRRTISALPLSDQARAVIETGIFRELTAADLAAALPALRAQVPLPVLLVGVVERSAKGIAIAQRVLLNRQMADFAATAADVHFYNPTDLIDRHGFAPVMKDMGHYHAEFEPAVGDVLAGVVAGLHRAAQTSLGAQAGA